MAKLIVYLSLAQFDSLVKVLCLPSAEKDFRYALTPPNLWKVFDHPEEFILSKVLRLNIESSGDA